MTRRALFRIAKSVDPFILALFATLVIATLLPARDVFIPITNALADAGIVLLFFLHGAKLSREAIVSGLTNWRLHLAVLAATFALFPLLGLGLGWSLRAIPGLAPSLVTGLVFLTLLPSTVQSSIAFTSIARGNVAAAVCAASFSNLVGIGLTPLLAFWLLGGAQIELSPAVIGKLFAQLLLPFVMGHLLRPLIGSFVARHRTLVSKVDRGSILLIVYTAFGAAVVEGLWSRVDTGDLIIIVLACLVLLGAVLALTRAAGRVLSFGRKDAIVLLFAGSKKSLATGVPIAGVLFAPGQIGAVLLPLMLYHQFQLTACAFIARRLARDAPDSHELAANRA